MGAVGGGEETRGEDARISLYGDEVAAQIRANYVGDCETCAEAGFGYPLTAVWLALPIAPLPDPLARAGRSYTNPFSC